jgi:hypothetical protein
MTKYWVSAEKTTYYRIEVEANSPQEAYDKADCVPISLGVWEENNTEYYSNVEDVEESDNE